MVLRKKIFLRLAILISFLTISICFIYSISAIRSHRKDVKNIYKKIVRSNALELSSLINSNDQENIRKRLEYLASHEEVAYAFLKKKGQLYISAFTKEIPKIILDKKDPNNSKLWIWKFKDKDKTFYDIASNIEQTDTSLHVCLSQEAIDEHVHSLLIMIVPLGIFTISVGIFLSFFYAQWTTKEVDKLTKKLAKNERKYHVLFESSPDFVFVLDKSGIILDVNSHGLRKLGYEKKDLIGLPISMLFTSHFKEIFIGEFSELFVKDDVQIELELLNKNNKIIKVDCRGSAVKNEQGQYEYFIIVGRDITIQKHMEEILREEREKYRALFEASVDAIFLKTLDGNILDCNSTACKMFDYKREELIGLNVTHLVPSEFARTHSQIISDLVFTGSIFFDSYGKKKDGTVFPTEISARLVEIEGKQMCVVYVRDITERKRSQEEQAKLQAQLRQIQKMEAIGTLAGGIAHDFNNILTVINGLSELAYKKANGLPSLQENLETIRKAGEKASQLVGQLLAFSRKQPREPKIIEVNKTISDLAKMLRRLIDEDIQFEMIFAENLPAIKADPSQIEQILINLIVNARDAIREKHDKSSEKRIIIETAYVFLDEHYVSEHPGSRVGPHVLISVSDTGIGMSDEVKRRIFEPFFTTKQMGRGTGLGLATVYGIVKQNNGCIYVYSEPGIGTTFKIYWPTIEEEILYKKDDRKEENLKGNETILLVEDDDLVRDFAYNALINLGYRVFEASNGKEALELIQKKNLRVDLLITDLIMPELNGKELAEKIKERFPSLPIIFISGYIDTHIIHNGVVKKDFNFIQKPFSIQTLAKKIRDTLDKSSSVSA